MKTNAKSDRDHQLLVMLNQVYDSLSKVRENELRPFGLSSQIQAGVLYHLTLCNEPVTIAEISRRLIRKPHTMSALLDRMERQGLVRRSKEPEANNRIMIEITEKGKQVYKQAREMKVIRTIFSNLTEKQRDNLLSYLRILRTKAFHNLGENLQPPFPL